MGRSGQGFVLAVAGVAALILAGCASPAWKQELAAELASAQERWSEVQARDVEYSVELTECGGCEAGALGRVVTVAWRDGQASSSDPDAVDDYAPPELFGLAEVAIEHAADETDVTLAFNQETGLPTRIDSTWDAADDGDFGLVIEVMDVQ